MPRSLSNPTTAHAPKPVVKEKDRDPVAAGKRDAAFNRSASFNYFLTDKFEAGVALRGTEVKSIREGKANLRDSYGLIKDGEAFLLNMQIGPYSHGNIANHEETRTRKLLLHRDFVVAAVHCDDVLNRVVRHRLEWQAQVLGELDLSGTLWQIAVRQKFLYSAVVDDVPVG